MRTCWRHFDLTGVITQENDEDAKFLKSVVSTGTGRSS